MNVATPNREVIAVERWLLLLYFMILAMVAIGGITRLTGSGLSMVDWRPLFGVLPPLNEAQWHSVFERYQQFPQYLHVNQWMQLDDFKRIYFWEYLHRLWGRTIGVVFALPFFWFWLRGKLPLGQKRRIAIAFLLGGAQGLLGWFMVKSGLADRPEVSHFRLAAHFMLANVVACWILWIWLDLRRGPRSAECAGRPIDRRMTVLLLIVVVVQMTYGAFMAGTRAGFLFSTFPTFNGAWLPVGLNPRSGWLVAAWSDPIMIHVIHRFLGLLVLTLVAATVWLGRQADLGLRLLNRHLLLVTALQVVLGIVTLFSHIDILLAVSHQLFGCLLLSVVIMRLHQLTFSQKTAGL